MGACFVYKKEEPRRSCWLWSALPAHLCAGDVRLSIPRGVHGMLVSAYATTPMGFPLVALRPVRIHC
eukprot:1310426-Lingulodinium_polyedra.AAC.1